MKKTCKALSIVLTLCTALHAQDKGQEEVKPKPDDEKAIRETVDMYYRGVVDRDRDLLVRAWDVPHAHMKYLQDMGDGTKQMKVVPISLAFEWWMRTKSEKTSGKILKLDVVDQEMAFVKFEFQFNAIEFIDYLTLYKLEGQWKIINKTFVKRMKEPPKQTEEGK